MLIINTNIASKLGMGRENQYVYWPVRETETEWWMIANPLIKHFYTAEYARLMPAFFPAWSACLHKPTF